MFRECGAPYIFLHALCNPAIRWRNLEFRLRWGGVAEAIMISPTPPPTTDTADSDYHNSGGGGGRRSPLDYRSSSSPIDYRSSPAVMKDYASRARDYRLTHAGLEYGEAGSGGAAGGHDHLLSSDYVKGFKKARDGLGAEPGHSLATMSVI